jgi:hypothetical protein
LRPPPALSAASALLAAPPISRIRPSRGVLWPLPAPPPFLAPSPPASTSPAPAPPSSSVVAVELRDAPEGKSRASWRAPPKGTAVHRREEPHAKRAKLPFQLRPGVFALESGIHGKRRSDSWQSCFLDPFGTVVPKTAAEAAP